MSLKQQALAGVRWTTLSTVIATATQALQLFVLARFLSPADFGLMAILTVMVGFAQVFVEMGLSNAIIHRKELAPEELSSLFWLNILAGLALTAVTFASATALAHFYHEPDLVALMRTLAPIFAITSVGNQFRALCQKELRFRVMAGAEITAAGLGFVTAFACAIAGLGAFALVFAALAQAIASSLTFLVIGRRHHRPTLRFRWSDIRSFVSFGLYQTGEKLLGYFTLQCDVLIIGKLLGVESAGIYNLAKTLTLRIISLINPIVTKVTLPILSQIQDDEARLGRIYLKSIAFLSLVSFPIFVFVSIHADAIVAVLFGPRWTAAEPILRILSLYALLRSTGNPIGTLLIAKGRADLGFRWNLGLAVLVPATIFLGLHWGTIGVACGLLILLILLRWPSWFFLVRPLSGIGFGTFMGTALVPLALAAGSGAASAAALGVANPLLRCGLAAILAASTYMVLLRYFQPEFLQTLLAMAPRSVRRLVNPGRENTT